MNNRKTYFQFVASVFLAFAHLHGVAQTHLVDSLKKQLNNKKDTIQLKLLGDISYYLSEYDPVESKQYAAAELKLANSINSVRYKIDALNNLALYYNTISNIDSAVLLQKQILAIAKANKWQNSIASAYNNLGTYYWQIDNLDSAMNYFVLALKIYEQQDRKEGIAKTTNNIAGILLYQKQYDLALPNYKKSLAINTIIKDSLELNNNFLNIGIAYEQLHVFDSALFYFDRALVICDKVSDRLTKSIVLGSLGNINHYTKNYNEALRYYSESIELNKLLGATDRLVESQISLGRTYLDLHELGRAEKIFFESLQQAKNINSKLYVRRAYAALADLYEAKADYKKAFEFRGLYSTMSDSLFNQESFQKIMDLNIKYESEKKAQQIALHQKEIEVLNQRAKIDQLRKSLLGGGLLASVLIGGVAFYGIRQKLTKQQFLRAKEKEDYEKDLAFKKKELAIHTLHLVQKGELLETIHTKLEELKQEPEANKNAIRRLVQLIKNDYQTEKDWENFKSYFEQVHEHFDAKLREHFNDLTHNEIRLATLLKMNLSTKEIATILSISPDSVNKARYRLRKKLNLSTEDSLENFLLAL